jgi:hypothetical protein
MPRGLEAEGQKLWESVVAVFDLSAEPHKRRILFDACKTADVVKRLDGGASKQPVTVKGSMCQEVIHPASHRPRRREENSPNCWPDSTSPAWRTTTDGNAKN